MVRFSNPAKRRTKRQSNSLAGAVNKVPIELFHAEFGVGPPTGLMSREWSSIRLLKDGNEFCLQIEDNTSGAEGWFTKEELSCLLTDLSNSMKRFK